MTWIKLSQKRACKGCKARRDQFHSSCELGFETHWVSPSISIPLEPCYKPLTNIALSAVYKYMELNNL